MLLFSAAVWAGRADKLFVRVPAKVFVNGSVSEQSAVYSSARGDIHFFPERPLGGQTVFRIGADTVGIPDGGVPSLDNLSIKTAPVVIVLDAEVYKLGQMGRETVRPNLTRTSDTIEFRFKDDAVRIRLDR